VDMFGRQAIPMVWDFAEAYPFSQSTGDLGQYIDSFSAVLETLIKVQATSGTVQQASATEHPLPDDCVDAFITDPPYYDAIPYADLSDFFYVWLRRMVRTAHPHLLADPLSPKEDECVTLAHRAAMYRHKDRSFFERMMTVAMTEGRRYTKPSGVGVVVFANKSTAGWEAMLSALVEAGWTVSASWPIDTEMSSRLRAQGSAVLASSVHLVCRPRENLDGSVRTDESGDWRDVLAELPRRIHEWMPRLAEEGIVGADAIFACLGPALEIFSRYSRVEKSSGEAVPLREYLEQVWAAVSREALSMIFKDADTAGLEPDARLTAMWLWTLGGGAPAAAGSAEGETGEEEADDEESGKASKTAGFALEFDAARKIAQGLGIHLEKASSVVEVKGETARLLSVAERTKHLFGKEAEDEGGKTRRKKKEPAQRSLFAELEAAEKSSETGSGKVPTPTPGATALDQVHQAMILFAAGRGEAMKRFLIEDGIGKNAAFWKLAQSLSALYPPGGDEKRWVDGVLARKKGLGL
jgi:putative DNA methylase